MIRKHQVHLSIQPLPYPAPRHGPPPCPPVTLAGHPHVAARLPRLLACHVGREKARYDCWNAPHTVCSRLTCNQCDGARPACVACQGRPNVKCVYDVTLDQRKPSSLRQRVGELEQEVCKLKDIFELLSNALPANLKARFQDFVQQIDDGHLSENLVAQLRSRLAMPQTPNELQPLQNYTQQMGNTDAKFSIGGNSQHPVST